MHVTYVPYHYLCVCVMRLCAQLYPFGFRILLTQIQYAVPGKEDNVHFGGLVACIIFLMDIHTCTQTHIHVTHKYTRKRNMRGEAYVNMTSGCSTLGVYVCVYVCVFVCTCVFVCACACFCMCVCICVYL